jgi:hypothetical protein
MQGKTRRTAGHGGRRATADHGEARRTGGDVGYPVCYCYALWNADRGLCPLPDLCHSLRYTITGVWEWRTGGEVEERRNINMKIPTPEYAR